MSDEQAIAFAQRVLKLAWVDLPPEHRRLLEAIGANEWDVANRPLGTYADELLRSAGYSGLAPGHRIGRDRARGLWIPELKVILVNAVHTDFDGLDVPSRENALARVAWHEWGPRARHPRSVGRGRGRRPEVARHLAGEFGQDHPIG